MTRVVIIEKTGGGIIHSEMPAMSEGKLHGFQLWVNMPA